MTGVACGRRLGVFVIVKMRLLSAEELRRLGLFVKDWLGEVEVSTRVVSGDLTMNFGLRLCRDNFLMRDL